MTHIRSRLLRELHLRVNRSSHLLRCRPMIFHLRLEYWQTCCHSGDFFFSLLHKFKEKDTSRLQGPRAGPAYDSRSSTQFAQVELVIQCLARRTFELLPLAKVGRANKKAVARKTSYRIRTGIRNEFFVGPAMKRSSSLPCLSRGARRALAFVWLHCNSFADDFRKQAASSRCHFGTVAALSAVILASVSARVRNLARIQFRTERRLPIALSSFTK